MSTHTPWGEPPVPGAYVSETDGLDRVALAHRNYELLRSRGAPVSVIVRQLGSRMPLCPVCGLGRDPARMFCSRSCASSRLGRLVAGNRRRMRAGD